MLFSLVKSRCVAFVLTVFILALTANQVKCFSLALRTRWGVLWLPFTSNPIQTLFYALKAARAPLAVVSEVQAQVFAPGGAVCAKKTGIVKGAYLFPVGHKVALILDNTYICQKVSGCISYVSLLPCP